MKGPLITRRARRISVIRVNENTKVYDGDMTTKDLEIKTGPEERGNQGSLYALRQNHSLFSYRLLYNKN